LSASTIAAPESKAAARANAKPYRRPVARNTAVSTGGCRLAAS